MFPVFILRILDLMDRGFDIGVLFSGNLVERDLAFLGNVVSLVLTSETKDDLALPVTVVAIVAIVAVVAAGAVVALISFALLVAILLLAVVKTALNGFHIARLADFTDLGFFFYFCFVLGLQREEH